MSRLQQLKKRELVNPPKMVLSGLQYEVIVGSMAYGVKSESSDMDIVGYSMPRRSDLFPQENGYIQGFDSIPQPFEQWQKHHVKDDDNGKEYDFTIYNIAKFFRLVMNANPNMIDTLFVPQNMILKMTPLANRVRENRHMFLSKLAWQTYKGYAYSQMKRMQNMNPKGNRKEIVEKYGYDVKYAYHIVRLLGFVEQILTKHDLDLQADNDRLMAIRRGEWTLDMVTQFFNDKEFELEKVFSNSTLREKPDYDAIRELLLSSLSDHYGDLTKYIPNQREMGVVNIIKDLNALIDRYGG